MGKDRGMKRLSGWRKRIAAAKKRGRFTDGDSEKASMWKSCAIGEARKTFPNRDELSDWSGDMRLGPKLSKWERLGCDFADHVYMNNFNRALAVLKHIEAGR